MRTYLDAARRVRWLLVTVVAVTWGIGIAAALLEYTTSYQADATVWVIRPSPELNVSPNDDPNVAIIQTAASQQAEVLKQLLQTRSFLADVVVRTSLLQSFQSAAHQDQFLDQVRRRFRVDTLGSSLLRVSYVGHDPRSPSELIRAAFAVRSERLAQARSASSAALSTLYQRQIEYAEGQAQDAQKALDEFHKAHKAPLSETDQHLESQLRLNLDLAAVGLSDLRGKMDRATLAPALLEASGLEFQVVDEPRVATEPGGGERSAITIAFVSLGAGAALATLIALSAKLIGDRRRPAEDRAVSTTRIATVA